MAARLLSGTETSKQIQAELLPQIEELKRAGVTPCLAAVLVGDNPASQIYVRSKMRACGGRSGRRNLGELPPAGMVYYDSTRASSTSIIGMSSLMG